MTEMRALIFELRPESLEKEGLVAALEKQAAAIQARHGIQVETAFGEEPDAPLEAKESLPHRPGSFAQHRQARPRNQREDKTGTRQGGSHSKSLTTASASTPTTTSLVTSASSRCVSEPRARAERSRSQADQQRASESSPTSPYSRDIVRSLDTDAEPAADGIGVDRVGPR